MCRLADVAIPGHCRNTPGPPRLPELWRRGFVRPDDSPWLLFVGAGLARDATLSAQATPS
ncbi:hypothetical protein WQ53_06990 [Pseudoxanthomonas suwonensis]|uniref:Uncharacterized protein n=1 Tax=Pseudoxanthomonas suwonensis TaxID=314722 RepID=A0A0E3UMS0_9GAMM|nr:hypothetical protein WQ53_06990 [Pseudoxanthomonas suwonensis]